MAIQIDRLSPDVQATLATMASRQQQLVREAARRSPVVFCAHVLRDEKTGQPIELAPMHREWHRLIDQHRRLVLFGFVESGKTNLISVGRTLWELGHRPNIRIAIVSKTKSLAQKIVRSIQQVVAGDTQASLTFRTVFPDVKPAKDPGLPWTSLALTIERTTPAKDPSVQACGNFGNIIGSRIDLLILDDVLDHINTRTPVPRQALWDWIRGTLIGRLTEEARVIIIGNAWHPDDCMHRFEREPGYRTFRFPVLDPQGVPVWPERWSLARIEAARQDFGPLDYARQLFCQPRDDDSSRFDRDHIERALLAGQALHFLRTRADAVDEMCPPEIAALHRLQGMAGLALPIFVGVDLAVQQHAAAHKTVFFTMAVDQLGVRRVLSIESGRWSAPEIMRRVGDHHARYQPVFIVENVAAQDYLVQIVREFTDVTVVPYTTGATKAHPEFGVEGIATELANSKWIIPERGHPDTFALVQGMLGYDPAGHTDDHLMAMFFAREGARGLQSGQGRGAVGVRILGDRPAPPPMMIDATPADPDQALLANQEAMWRNWLARSS